MGVFDGKRAVWQWQYSAQGEQSPAEVAATLGQYAGAAVWLVKAMDGGDWMSRFDTGARAIGSVADWQQTAGAARMAGLVAVPWVVPNGPGDAAAHAQLAPVLVVDLEPYPQFWSAAAADVGPYLQALRTGGVAELYVSLDPRPQGLAALAVPSWAGLVDGLLPQCQPGDTPVTLADGSTRPLGDLVVGDVLIAPHEAARCWMFSAVVQTHARRAAVYRIVTDRGEVLATAEHPWLSRRPGRTAWQWYRTAPAARARGLSPKSRIPWLPACERPKSPAYKLGYIAGIALGDGYGYQNGEQLVIRMWDREPVERVAGYLGDLGVQTGFGCRGDGARRPIAVQSRHKDGGYQVQTSAQRGERQPRGLEGAAERDGDYARGFLGGIYDAEGTRGPWDMRIAQQNPRVRPRIEAALVTLGFRWAPTSPKGDTPTGYLILGGMQEQWRFWQETQPALLRKHPLVGKSVYGHAEATVIAVEPAGETDVYSIATTSGTYLSGGMVSHNCYWTDFGQPAMSCIPFLDSCLALNPNVYPVLPYDAAAGDLLAFWNAAQALGCRGCSLWRLGSANADQLRAFRALSVQADPCADLRQQLAAQQQTITSLQARITAAVAALDGLSTGDWRPPLPPAGSSSPPADSGR